MPSMEFEKWHGIGNDFLIVDERTAGTITPEDAIAVCDRHFGVGADGILVLGPSDVADARMLIHNADGSMADMCGNGIRVAARWLVERGLVAPEADGSFSIETSGGIMRPSVLDEARVRVDMGELTSEGIESIDLPDGSHLTGRLVSVGNPHFVVHREPEGPSLHVLGPQAEHHARFPDRSNIEFYEIDDAAEGRVRMRVWERGVGETLACGTGACAVAYTARADSGFGDRITVALPGGDLEIEFDGDRAFMTGAAHRAWAGELDVAAIRAGMPALVVPA